MARGRPSAAAAPRRPSSAAAAAAAAAAPPRRLGPAWSSVQGEHRNVGASCGHCSHVVLSYTEAQVNAHKSSTELPSLIIWRQHPPAGSRFTAAAPRRPRFEGPASPSSSPPVQPLTVCDTMGNHTQSACCTARAVGAHARAGPRWGRRHLASRATDHPNTAHLRALVAAPPSAAPAAAAPLPPPRRRLGRNPPHPRPPALQEEAGARPPRQMQRGGREAGARRPAAAAAGPPRCCLTLASPPAPPGGGLFLLGLLAQRLPQGLCLLLVLLQGAAGC